MIKKIYAKFLWIIAVLFLAGFLGVLAIFWNRLAFPDDFRFFGSDDKQHLIPGEPIAQTFTASDDNLAQLKILTGNIEKMKSSEKFTVSIFDENCQNSLRTADFLWPFHSPKQYDIYALDPIPESGGKKYCLVLLYESEVENEDSPFVRIMEKTGNPDEYFLNLASGEKFYGQSMIFRPKYKKESVTQTLDEFSRRLGAYKADYLKGENIIYIFSGFLILTLITSLIFIFLRDNE